MHDIWNPWHGCKKISEGCDHCYMYCLDARHGKDGREFYPTKNGFDKPLKKNRRGDYKIKSGEMIRVCMTSDFFFEEADEWREEVWRMMEERRDVIFYLLTKRPERIMSCLPKSWEEGRWAMNNVSFNVSAENQRRVDERIPILLSLPFKHKGVMCAPLIGSVDLAEYLEKGQIEQVICGGENYDGNRICDFEWVKSLSEQCRTHDVKYTFIETGTYFVKDNQGYKINSKLTQTQIAYKADVNVKGKEIQYELVDDMGYPIESNQCYTPMYRDQCRLCGSRPICNGCSDCGRCDGPMLTEEELA